MASINGRFISRNMYGSSAHRRAAEERAQEINRATLGERTKLLQESMKSELALGHQGQLSNLRQLGLYGDQGQKEFGDTLSKIRDMNKLGSTKWGNEQAENEDLYKNYQNEAAWEWPHMKGVIAGQARSGALGDVFRGLENRNISLDQLAALNTNYSELQKENVARRAELNTGNQTIADLQRQLGIFNAQKAQQQQAAQQQAAQQKQQAAQAAESQRLNRLQQAANREAEARMKADQDRAYAAEGWIPSGVGWYKPGNADAGWIRARLQGR